MSEAYSVADLESEDEPPHLPPGDDRGKAHWIQTVTVVLVVITLVLVLSVMVKKQQKKAALTEASSNMRSIFYLMVEFDQDYGGFPGDGSAIDELEGLKGDYSNDYFAQFHVAGFTRSEEVFYAKGGASVERKADNRLPWLDAGECGLALVIGTSTANDPATPIVLAAMGRRGLEFKSEPFDGKAAVLRVDGAVKHLMLDEHNRAVIGGGKTLFEGGKGSVWGDAGFDLKRLKHAK